MKKSSVILIFSLTIATVLSQAPVFNNIPATRAIGEQEVGGRLFYILNITEPNGGTFTCNQTISTNAGTGTPTGNEFNLVPNPTTGNYEVRSNAAGTCCTFNFTNIREYALTHICVDALGETTSPTTLIASVQDNARVTINNVDGEANDLTVACLTTGNNVFLKTVTTSSILNHDIQLNATFEPSFSPEFFRIDSASGEIRTNRELQYLDSSIGPIYMTITAYDTSDQIVVYATQTIKLTNQNTIPSAVNLPLVQSVLETYGAGAPLFTLTVSDPDNQNYNFSFTCTPAEAADTFAMNNNGQFFIQTGRSLDFESISFYNCSCYVGDGIHTGGPFNYQLTVVNDNEAPSFSETMYYVTTIEANQGTTIFNPGLICTDPDFGDTIRYEFAAANNSDRFSITPVGNMSFAINYDVDNNVHPTNLILTCYCIDSGGVDNQPLTATTQITVTINDANDNEPTFSSSSYVITVDQFQTPGTIIGTLAPTDADSGSNAALTCEVGTVPITNGEYFNIASNCEIRVARTIDYAAGTVVQYVVLAKDDGNPRLTGTATVDIVFQETTTTTTTTTTTEDDENFFDRPESIALLVLLLLALLALLGLLAWCLARMCCGAGGRCGNSCSCFNNGRGRRKRYPLRQVTPETPPRRKFRPPSPDTPPRRGGMFTVSQQPVVRATGRMVRAPPSLPGFYR